MAENILDGYQEIGTVRLRYGYYPNTFNFDGTTYSVKKVSKQERIILDGIGIVHRLRLNVGSKGGQFEVLNPEGTNTWYARRLGL
jgi:hypothetical protein